MNDVLFPFVGTHISSLEKPSVAFQPPKEPGCCNEGHRNSGKRGMDKNIEIIFLSFSKPFPPLYLSTSSLSSPGAVGCQIKLFF